MKTIKKTSWLILLALSGIWAGCGTPKPENKTPAPTPDHKAVASIGAVSSDFTVYSQDRVVEFTISLSEKVEEEVIVSITAEGDNADAYTLNTERVTIPAGSTSGKGSFTFKSSAFPDENAKAKLKLTISSEHVKIDENAKSVEFTAKGAKSDEQPVTAKITAEYSTVIVEGSDVNVLFTVTLSGGTFDDPETFTVTPSSNNEGSYTLNNATVTVPAGSTSVQGSVTFKAASFPNATAKTALTLTITAPNTEISENDSKVTINASGKKEDDPDPEIERLDYRLTFRGENQQIQVAEAGPTDIFFWVHTTGYVNPSKSIDVNLKVTGGVEGVDYEFNELMNGGKMPMYIPPTENYVYVYVKIYAAAANKILQFDIESKGSTLGELTTLYVEVFDREWPPLKREAPGYNNNKPIHPTWGVQLTSMTIDGGQQYSFPADRNEWEDYYNVKSFEVKKGANEVQLTVTLPKGADQPFENMTWVALYADYNNNGVFSDTGERVKLDYAQNIKLEQSTLIRIGMVVPDNLTVTEFPVRLGVFAYNGSTSGVARYFRNGYFVNPGETSQIQMVDFKFIVTD